MDSLAIHIEFSNDKHRNNCRSFLFFFSFFSFLIGKKSARFSIHRSRINFLKIEWEACARRKFSRKQIFDHGITVSRPPLPFDSSSFISVGAFSNDRSKWSIAVRENRAIDRFRRSFLLSGSGEKQLWMPSDFRLRQYAGIPLRLGTFTDLLQMLQLGRGRYVSAAAAGIQMLGRWQWLPAATSQCRA